MGDTAPACWAGLRRVGGRAGGRRWRLLLSWHHAIGGRGHRVCRSRHGGGAGDACAEHGAAGRSGDPVLRATLTPSPRRRTCAGSAIFRRPASMATAAAVGSMRIPIPSPISARGRRRLAAEEGWRRFADRRAVDLFRLAGHLRPSAFGVRRSARGNRTAHHQAGSRLRPYPSRRHRRAR